MNRRQMLKGLANSALVIASAASTASRSQHAVKGTPRTVRV